jgi:hypothetical protein
VPRKSKGENKVFSTTVARTTGQTYAISMEIANIPACPILI